jgi:CubicO group peptidase (beta-lactamase class C family)
MKILKTISIIFLTCLKVLSQDIDFDKKAAIDSIVNKYAKEYSIVGLSIGIVENDSTYTHHFGNTDLENRFVVFDSTMFHLASISKLFTATAILQLVENNKLSLEDKLVDILPEFRTKDKRYAEIRVRHLLTHSSGLKWNNKLKKSPDDTSSISLYIQNLEKSKLKFTPGEKMSYKTYSNVGYNLLGIVVERVSGQRFDDYIYENILQPVEMYRSTYYYEEIDSSHLAIPQIVAGNSRKIRRLNLFGIDSKRNPIIKGEPLQLESYSVYGEEYEHNPSGNLISTAKELTLWMQHNLEIYSDSTFKGILKQSTLKEMWATQKGIPDSRTSIGWGWWIYQDDKFGTSVFHVGNNPGFCSILMIYPEKNFGITILCNGWYAQEVVWHKITEEITNLYLEE